MSLYSDTVLADAPAGYWRMDQASGNLTDSSGNGTNTAASTGTPLYSQGGLINSDSASTSVRFSGAETFNTAAAVATLDFADVFTMEAWVKTNVAATTMIVMDKDVNAYQMRINGSDQLQLSKSTVGDIVVSTSTIALGVPTHLVITKTGATVKLYINAVDVTGAVSNLTFANNNASSLRFGATPADSAYMNGWLDELAVYPTALSAARVLAHYQASVAIVSTSFRTDRIRSRRTSW